MLVRGVQAIDDATATAASKGLRIFVSDERAITSVKTRLENGDGRGKGPVNLVLMSPDLPGEVELTLPGDYPLSPQIQGAIKAAQGVIHIEEF
jgi:DNA polymerase-3 subunit alpha